jgi:hypothetical protein
MCCRILSPARAGVPHGNRGSEGAVVFEARAAKPQLRGGRRFRTARTWTRKNRRSEGGRHSKPLISYPVCVLTGYRDPQNPDALALLGGRGLLGVRFLLRVG